MDTHGFFSGVLQKLTADQLKPYVDKYLPYVVGAGMTWLRAKVGSWAIALWYGLIAAVCLYVLLGGLNRGAVASLHTPATACDMRIGRSEYLQLAEVLSGLRRHLPTQEVTIIVEPGKVEACPYAYDLKSLFLGVGWNPAPIIKDREVELIERDVWFYRPPNDGNA
jgi:hypothetical protein